MPGARRQHDEITRRAFKRVYRAARAHIEQARAFDEEAHLVVIVNVFGKELGAQGLAIGMLGRHADNIDALVSAARLQPCDVGRIRCQNFGIVDGLRDVGTCFPAFKHHSCRRDGGGDFSKVGGFATPPERRSVVITGKAGHGRPF